MTVSPAARQATGSSRLLHNVGEAVVDVPVGRLEVVVMKVA
jgi:hypothetical protein